MKLKKAVIIVFVYIIVIFILHLIPTGMNLHQIKIGSVRMDYLLHLTLFLPWMSIVWINRYRSDQAIQKGAFFAWLLAGIMLAVVAECFHYWISYRVFHTTDMLFNIAGVILGSAIFLKNVRK